MDADMAMIHCVSLIYVSLIATAASSAPLAALSMVLALAINGMALATIGFSKADDGADLTRELLFRRYPLVGASTYLESMLLYALHGDAHNAMLVCAVITISGCCAALDGPLGGWGHVLCHLVLLPGMHCRADGLVAAVA